MRSKVKATIGVYVCVRVIKDVSSECSRREVSNEQNDLKAGERGSKCIMTIDHILKR